MSTKKTEVKVCINCQKCKTAVMKAVAKLTGVDEVKLDSEKGVLTIIGKVDPVCVAATLRKAGYWAEITSVGPPKIPDVKPKSSDDKPKSPEKPKPCELPPCCKQCQLVGVSYVTYDGAVCSIL